MSRPEGRKERKLVTVLFADLVGFTARAEPLDPEDVEAILEPYHTRLRSELERFGGTVEKFIGDAVVAVFGAPVAREDDPERAVRAALAIRDWIVGEGVDLDVRIAVNTGEVLLTLDADADAGEHFASGDVLNTASRLQAAAPINGILVGETTYRATRRVIEYGEHEPVVATGKAEPIRVWEGLDAPSRFRAVCREPTQLIGRRRELDILLDALARAREERGPQLVTVMGVPGIGKSRLVYELAKAVDADPKLIWRQGRSLSYGEGVTFWALGEIVKAHAGILEADPAEEAEAKLGQALADLFGDDGERPWVEAHLRPLVGLGSEAELGDDRRHEAFVAWRRFFEALAERRPLALVFEDLHWADEGVLDFLDHLVDWASGVPILIVATARPELFVRRPGWAGGKANAVTISLSPLSDEQTAQLVQALLARSVMPAEVEHVLLERAGGNPLYAEEFVRMFAEHGEGKLPLPEAVQGIIAARLDTLQREEKELLQSAAVVGDVFWSGAVATLGSGAPAEVEQRMHTLERKEFVRRRRRASVEAETEFAFSHALIREVAYDQIPRARRAEKHGLAAKWIDSLGRPEDHAELVAHHCLRALEYGRPATQETTAVAERARGALREAGDRALALNAYAAAAGYYRAALQLWPREDADRPYLLFRCGKAAGFAEQAGFEELTEASERLAAMDPGTAAEAELLLANLAWFGMSRAEADAHLARATELVDAAPASRSKASVLGAVSALHATASEYEDAIRVGQEALQLAEQLDLPDIRAGALNTIGCGRVGTGDPRGLDAIEQSIVVATEANSPPNVVRGYSALSGAFVDMGDLDRAVEAQREGLRLAKRFGLLGQARFLGGHVMQQQYFRGTWDGAVRSADEAIAAAHERRLHYSDRDMHEFRGRIRLARDDVAGAVEDAVCALELAHSAREPQSLLPALALTARVQCARGRADEAGLLMSELFQVFANTGFASPASFFSADLVVALRMLGREDEFLRVANRAPARSRWFDAAAAFASGDPERAADVYAEIGSVPDEAYARLRAAEQLLDQGRRADADEQLERALAFWRSVGATRYVREGEALLAATA
jgi:class 3 adenylate cyclase